MIKSRLARVGTVLAGTVALGVTTVLPVNATEPPATSDVGIVSNEDFYAANANGTIKAHVSWTDSTDNLCITGLNLTTTEAVKAYIAYDGTSTRWYTPADSDDPKGNCTGNLSIREDAAAYIVVLYRFAGPGSNWYEIHRNYNVYT